MISRRQFGDISAIHAKNDLGVLALQFSAGRVLPDRLRLGRYKSPKKGDG